MLYFKIHFYKHFTSAVSKTVMIQSFPEKLSSHQPAEIGGKNRRLSGLGK